MKGKLLYFKHYASLLKQTKESCKFSPWKTTPIFLRRFYVMKKVALFFSACFIAVSISLAKADTFETPSAIDHAIEIFVNNWSTDGARADIQFSNGYFQVHIETFDGGYESNKWAYLCTYDEHHQALVASNNGTKTTYTYNFDTDCETESMAYQNGSAVFFAAA